MLWLLGALCCFVMFFDVCSMRVMEYNVENMFDTLHTAGLSDIDFTPTGSYQWNSQRYWAKLGRLSRVIAAAGGAQPIDLLALVEIENDSVVNDLIHHTKLWRMGYECVVSHSADVRGINVALVYLPYRFRLLSKDSLRVAPQGKTLRPTRDILHVAGELVTGDTLDVYVCHFPSRRGGKQSQNFRESVAQHLRHYVDSVMCMRSQPNVLIMGADKSSIKINSNSIDYVRFKDLDFIEEVMNNRQKKLSVYGRLNLNSWGGRKSLQIFIDDYDFQEEDNDSRFDF